MKCSETKFPSDKKICTRCKTCKEISEFGTLISKADGLRHECNDCRIQYRRNTGQKERKILARDVICKQCPSCMYLKCMSEFSVNLSTKDLKSSVCKKCLSRRRLMKTVFSGGKPITKHIYTDARACSGCGVLKTLDNFPAARQCKDGRASECKECKKMKRINKNLESPEPTEHQEAVGFINWFHQSFPNVFIYHIPNGMKRDIKSAKALKEEGVKRGVPDYHIPEWGLWVELKRVTKGCLSADQKNVIQYLESIGQKVIVGRGARDASEQVLRFRGIYPGHR